VSSGLPTTPTPSPTAESYDVAAELKGQAVIRCKSIKPLAIVKRACPAAAAAYGLYLCSPSQFL
jgi:hypothetical protein